MVRPTLSLRTMLLGSVLSGLVFGLLGSTSVWPLAFIKHGLYDNVCFSSDGRLLVARDVRKAVIMAWDADTGTERGCFTFGTNPVVANQCQVAVTSNCKLIVCRCANELMAWDVISGEVKCQRTFDSPFAVSPDGTCIIECDKHGMPTIVKDVLSGRNVTDHEYDGSGLLTSVVSPDGSALLLLYSDRCEWHSLGVTRSAHGRPIESYSSASYKHKPNQRTAISRNTPWRDAAIAPDNRGFAVSERGTLSLYQCGKRDAVAVINLPDGEMIASVQWSPESTAVGVMSLEAGIGSGRGTYRIYDSSTGGQMASCTPTANKALLFGARGRVVGVSTFNWYVWDAHTGQLLEQQGEVGQVDTPTIGAISPTAAAFAKCSTDGLEVWKRCCPERVGFAFRIGWIILTSGIGLAVFSSIVHDHRRAQI